MGQCEFTKVNRNRCRAPALTGSKLCFFHEPSQAAKRRRAQSSGSLASSEGRSRWLWKEVEPRALDTLDDIAGLIVEQLNELRGLEPSPRKATAIFYGVNLLVKLYELLSLEQRLSEFERLFDVEVKTWALSQPCER